MFRAAVKHAKQFATAVGLLLLSVLLAEFVLQFKTPPPSPVISSQTTRAMQELLAPSAVVHHEMKRLSRHQPDGPVMFKTNSFGLRGTEPEQPKPRDVIRILVLGDETVLGAELADENTMPFRLQGLLVKATGRKIEVINGGVPGYSPLLSLLQFQHELNQLSPDIVILHFDMSDVADDAVYRRWLKESDGRQICLNPILAVSSESTNPALSRLQQSALVRLLQGKAGLTSDAVTPIQSSLQQRYEWTTGARSDLRLQVKHALEPVSRLANYVQQRKLLLLVSSAPVPWQITSSDQFPSFARQINTASAWPIEGEVPQRILNAVCDQASVAFCNVADAFRAFSQPDKLFKADSTELSAYGNALYAREIASMLLQTPKFAGLLTPGNRLSAQPSEMQ